MPTPPKRPRPYGQFNFLVDLGTGDTQSADAGFQECSNLGMEMTVAEYRAGNSKENGVMKLTMMNKSSDVTLKRGVMGSSTLYDWLHEIRQGSQTSLRTVRVHLMSEDHLETVATWSMLNARIIKYTTGPFNGKGGDLAMEDLTLAFERLEAEFPGMTVSDVRPLPGVVFEAGAPAPSRVLPRMDVVGFVGFTTTGPLDRPVPVESPAEFERVFGRDVELAWDPLRSGPAYGQVGPAIRDYFANGGRRAWVVRVADRTITPSRVPLPGLVETGLARAAHRPASLLATSPGSWADGLEVGAALIADPLSLTITDVGQQDLHASVSSAQNLVAGDLVRVDRHEGGVFLLPVVHAEMVPVGRLAQGRREQAVVLSATSACWLPQSVRVGAGAGAATYVGGTGQEVSSVLDGGALDDRDVAAGESVDVDLTGPGLTEPPSVGSMVRVEGLSADGHELWLLVTASGALESNGPTERGRPSFRVSVGGTVAWLGALPVGALSTWAPGLPASRLSLELHVRIDGGPRVLSELGLLPEHPRFLGDLLGDADAFAGPTGSDRASSALRAEALAGRFPLAGAGARNRFLPVHVGAVPGPVTRAHVAQGSRLARDGLGTLDELLFLDERMTGAGVDTLVALAADLQWHQQPPSRPHGLHGLHALLGVDEVTVVAVPDAAHRGWQPWEDRPAPPAPRSEAPADEDGCPGDFVECVVLDVPATPRWILDDAPAPHVLRLRWTEVEGATSYVVQEGTDPTSWDGARDLRPGTGATEILVRAFSESSRFYRVRAVNEDVVGGWSAGLAVAPTPGLSSRMTHPRGYRADVLLGVHRAALRMCAARGDLLVLLSAPQHYRAASAAGHAAALRATDGSAPPGRRVTSLGPWEAPVLGFGALFHPWLVRASGPGAGEQLPVVPDGAVAGIVAKRARNRGAWVAPANETLQGVVALAQAEPLSTLRSLQDAQVNPIRQDARGFLWMSEDTLAHDSDARPMNVRRLVALVRRMALLEGTSYVFEPNDPVLRRAVERGFGEAMQFLYSRGAFAGASAREAFRVNVGDPPNTAQSVDLGRLVVELMFAPSRALAFLRVRLVRTGDQGFRLVEDG